MAQFPDLSPPLYTDMLVAKYIIPLNIQSSCIMKHLGRSKLVVNEYLESYVSHLPFDLHWWPQNLHTTARQPARQPDTHTHTRKYGPCHFDLVFILYTPHLCYIPTFQHELLDAMWSRRGKDCLLNERFHER